MSRILFRKILSALLAAVLLVSSLFGTPLAGEAYAAEDAPDPMAEAAELPEEDAAALPEDAAVRAEDAVVSSEEAAAAEPAEEPAADPSSESSGDESAADPDADSAAASSGTVPSAGEGKYVSDVFIAYGKTVEEAEEWLIANGWEPLPGNNNFNAGKASYWDDSVAAAMGIRRTDKAEEAITDLAVMNMKGGYSIPDYQELVEEKKTEIDEFINAFKPVIEEFRDNYNGKGSQQGKRRAELAYTMLNKFIDGNPKERYAANDTGLPLGKLFLNPMRNEEGGAKGGDLQQIILESSAPAVLAIEQTLVFAADTGSDTWLDRLSGITLEKMMNNVGEYVPEAAGQDVPYSAAGQFLGQTFGDAASKMIPQWKDINEKMLWYEDFNNEHDLWQYDGESDEDYVSRYVSVMQDLQEDPEIDEDDLVTYDDCDVLYQGLYEVKYPGIWGDTLGDFFNPAEDNAYVFDSENYFPLAAALSVGQRRSLDLVSLYSLIMLGLVDDEGVEALLPDVEELFGDAMSISVYRGVNRGIFRNGVALTSEALMTKSRGYDPFNDIFDIAGAYNIVCYSTAIIGIGVMAAGITKLVKAAFLKKEALENLKDVKYYNNLLSARKNNLIYYNDMLQHPAWSNAGAAQGGAAQAGAAQAGAAQGGAAQAGAAQAGAAQAGAAQAGAAQAGASQAGTSQAAFEMEYYTRAIKDAEKDIAQYEKFTADFQNKADELKSTSQKLGSSGRTLMAIGGAILIAAAIVKGYQIYRYYQKEFTPIPMMIVDEADIVSYVDNGDGTTTKTIEFDSFVYYEAVRCNRDKKHKLSDWQDGVSDYEGWGCGDVADLNVDQGQEWLALYAVRSPKKGYPILADSLTMQYGSDKQPAGTTRALHFFTFTYAADIGDTAYCYNNDKGGIYFFWDEDTSAYDVPTETASAFSSGYLAIAALGGLLVGILGTTIVLYPRRKREPGKA